MMAAGREKKLEYLVLASILAVLLLGILEAIGRLQRQIEEAAVLSEITALRVEILDRLSHREVFGGMLPSGDNPVDWAGRRPMPYAGEMERAPVEQGVWYFDTADRVLVFRSRHGADFRFRLMRADGRQQAPAVLAGVGLVRIDGGK